MVTNRNPNSRRTIRMMLAAIGIGTFLAVDATLLIVAVTMHSSVDSNVAPYEATVIATDTPPSSEPGNAAMLLPATRLLTAFNADSAWRTTVASCPEGNEVVEHTTDGGKSWDGFDLASNGGLSSASALQALGDPDSVYLVALDRATCTVSWVGTTNGGDDWAAFPDRAASSWYLDPTNPATIHAPGATRSAPCTDAVRLAPLSGTSAAIICSDQSIFRTEDNGATWAPAPSVPGASAIAQGPTGYVVAATSTAITCTGVTVSNLAESTSDRSITTSKCIPTGTASDEVAIAGNTEALWLWVGSAIIRSRDGGTTWR